MTDNEKKHTGPEQGSAEGFDLGVLEHVDAETEEKVEKILREHDTAARHRLDADMGWWRWFALALGLGLTLFQFYTAIFGSRPILVQGAIHVGGALGLIYLLYPIHKKFGLREDVSSRLYVSSLVADTLLALLAMGALGYIVLRYDYLTGVEVQLFGYSSLDTAVALLGIVLILEATRRCVGLPIVVIATLALLYFWLGKYSPILPHAGSSWQNVVQQTFFTTRSIFGTPIQVSSTFVFLFLVFGVLLVKTDIGGYFNGLAFKITGRFTGGPAKAAVVASAMQGTVTGSSVANAVASGSFTIPMMKKVGFKPTFAAATEATASTGGQIMPPIMGAAVFIMAEYTAIPYSTIILVAIVPAVLYFAGAMFAVHFEAKRYAINGIPKDQLPAWRFLAARIDLLIPLALIITLLLSGRTPANAALWGIVAAFAVSFFRASTRLDFKGIIGVLEGGARTALPVIAACATAGMVAGIVTATGLGGQLSSGILAAAGGNFFLVLFFTMIACIVLGMGLPTTANYVVTASVAAPVLINNFDVPILAAHLFVFYFGLLADITPPVCLAAYAASGIAGSNPLKSGVTALRVALAGFLVPYVFVIDPALLFQDDEPIWRFCVTAATVIVGMIAIAAGTARYFFDFCRVWESAVLVLGGILLVYPDLVTAVVGLLIIVAMGVWQSMRQRAGHGVTIV